MLRLVALVRTDVPEEPITSIIRMTRIGELGTTLAVTINLGMLRIQLLVTANVVLSSPVFTLSGCRRYVLPKHRL
jgi:nickel-dependent lactate racemase